MSDAESWAAKCLVSEGSISKKELETLFSLLPKQAVQRGPRDVKSAFVFGCYAQGGFRGLRKECAIFPNSCRLVTRYVSEQLPGHVFSTCGIFSDAATPLHRDGRNAHWPNAIFRLSSFKEGGLWIEGSGADVRVHRGQELSGSVHEITEEPLVFDAWARHHQTEPWRGHRLVLVTWVVEGLDVFENALLDGACALGFVLPPNIPRNLATSDLLCQRPCVFELFAGKGRLSRALATLGFGVHSFDHNHCDSQVPLLQLDLSKKAGQAIVWDIIERQQPFATHLGVPCGTASQARGRPLRNGAPGPRPLRSKDFPLGLPTLVVGSADHARVLAANDLFLFTYRMLSFCLARAIIVCVENPANSFLWDVLRAFEPALQAKQVLPRLTEVCFDQCCHGGARPKRTKLLCTPNCFESLSAVCPGNHAHRPWGQIMEYGTSRFATKDEAAYPAILANRYALCLAKVATCRGHSLVPKPTTKDQSLAALGKQNKRQPPLVSEFATTQWMPFRDFRPAPHLKLLRPRIGGDEARASGVGSDASRDNTPLGTILEAPESPGNTPLGTILEAPESPGRVVVDPRLHLRKARTRDKGEVLVGVHKDSAQFVHTARAVAHSAPCNAAMLDKGEVLVGVHTARAVAHSAPCNAAMLDKGEVLVGVHRDLPQFAHTASAVAHSGCHSPQVAHSARAGAHSFDTCNAGTAHSSRAGAHSVDTCNAGTLDKGEVLVGVLRTPAEFVHAAKAVAHPMDTANPLEPITLAALKENLTKDPKLVSLKRNLAVARVKQEVMKHREAEERLHQSMHPSVAKVMKGKSILALEALLRTEGYGDMGVISFLKEGVRLVGTSECPECFEYKLVPAPLTESELFETAAERRTALLSKDDRVSADESRILKEATDSEVALGFLEGPFYEHSEVSAKLGTEAWTVIRRFVLIQGAEQKPRPIDNCLEAQLNAGFSSSIHLRLQDSDYISAMALHVAGEIKEGRAHASARTWKGKCLDLSKAYKQLAVFPDHRPLAVIAVRQEDGRDALYLSNSLMFGSTAAVYSFNRVSRALWFLINRLLWIPAGVYYDDFPLMCPAASSGNADECVSSFLDALGWLHAKTGTKGQPFTPEFAVLGMCLDLGQVDLGCVTLSNKQGRIERIIDRLQEISAKGEITRHEAQVLQGLLQYASGFFAGRSLRHACHILARIVAGLHFSSGDLSSFCCHTVGLLRLENPRILSSGMIKDVLHLWTDGSWEAGVAGIGLAAHDCFSGAGWVYEGLVPANLLEHWKAEVGDQLICEIELFAILASMLELTSMLQSRRIVWWVDNDAARSVLIKGASRSWAMHSLARIFTEIDREFPSMWWVCRVPSFSNPGDAPSRGHGSESVTMVGASKVQAFSQLGELSSRIHSFKRAF